MKRSLLLTALLAMLLTGMTAAQAVQRITIEEAIKIALENNYSLKVAENNLGLAEDRITSEMADFLPGISSSLNANRQTGRQFVQETLSFTDVTSQSISGRISASVPIFNGFENILSLRISQKNKLSSEQELQRAKENIIFNTASRYLQVLLSMELLEIAKENLETSERQLEQIRAQVEVGSRPMVDLYNQESTVAQNELTVTERENTLNLNKLILIRQLQIDPLGNYEFVTPELEVSSATPMTASLRQLIDEALRSRSDLRSEKLNVDILAHQLQLAKSSLLPTLSASASLSSGYSDQYTFGGQDVSFQDQFFDQRVNRGVGLSFSLPLFNNWNRMYNIQSAKINLKNAELNYENSELGVIQEVTQAYNDYIAYQKRLEASNKALIAAEKAYETEQERYDVGASTLIELSQAQASYVSAQSDKTQAEFNLIFQAKLLDFYLGKLSGDSIEF